MWHPKRVAQWLRGERIAPITVDLALTQACNYKCAYCYGQLQKQPQAKPWTDDMIKATFDDFKLLGVKAVSLVSDGESTCNRHWVNAIRYAHHCGLDVALGTHGANLSTETLTKILPMLTYLRFNISAATLKRYQEIHNVSEKSYFKVLSVMREAVRLRSELGSGCTLGAQMVFAPQYNDQVIPLTYLCKGIGLDYLMIKHMSDDEKGKLKVDYDKYPFYFDILRQAERATDEFFEVIVKWNKIRAGNKRPYKRCLAVPFQLQLSGSGLVAPCGMFFHPSYVRWHIGNLHENRFIEIWQSDRYWEVMDRLAGDHFNAQKMCGCLCLQDAANIWLNKLSKEYSPGLKLKLPEGTPPAHVNFI